MRTKYQKLKFKLGLAATIAGFLILGILFFMVGREFQIEDRIHEAICSARGLHPQRIAIPFKDTRIVCVDLQGTEIQEEK